MLEPEVPRALLELHICCSMSDRVCSTHLPGHSALRDGIRAELGERRGGCQGRGSFMASFLQRSCQVAVELPQGDDGDGGRYQARPWRMTSCGCKLLKCKAHAQNKLAELKPKVRAKACMVCHMCLFQVYVSQVVLYQKRPRSPPARAHKVRFCRVCWCCCSICIWLTLSFGRSGLAHLPEAAGRPRLTQLLILVSLQIRLFPAH